MNRNRKPQGTPSGGEFDTTPRDESLLDEPLAATVDPEPTAAELLGRVAELEEENGRALAIIARLIDLAPVGGDRWLLDQNLDAWKLVLDGGMFGPDVVRSEPVEPVDLELIHRAEQQAEAESLAAYMAAEDRPPTDPA